MTNEYQPLDPKEWLADPEGFDVEFHDLDGNWRPLKFGIRLDIKGQLKEPHRHRMRRKAKPVVRYCCISGGHVANYPNPFPAATHVVTFGPDDKSSSCRRVK
jgi:hypothetical protein